MLRLASRPFLVPLLNPALGGERLGGIDMVGACHDRCGEPWQALLLGGGRKSRDWSCIRDEFASFISVDTELACRKQYEERMYFWCEGGRIIGGAIRSRGYVSVELMDGMLICDLNVLT
jgi:hypothetical protein